MKIESLNNQKDVNEIWIKNEIKKLRNDLNDLYIIKKKYIKKIKKNSWKYKN